MCGVFVLKKKTRDLLQNNAFKMINRTNIIGF